MVALITVATLTTTLNGCKKGANDPLISFKSRDSRIVGIWTMESSEATDTDISSSSGVASTTVTVSSYNGTILTTTTTASGLSGTSAVSHTEKLTIEKDGTYEKVTTTDGAQSTYTGYWWWLDSKKNKTRIAFDDDANSFYIDQLIISLQPNTRSTCCV